jgi:translation initiation factor IF-3
VKARKVRINRQILAPKVRLIDVDGKQLGVVFLKEAILKAEEADLDLVEIAPETDPPVCRVMDYGKYLFEQSKKTKKKSRQIQIKEIKMRPVTDVGDYTTKIRKTIAFLQEGDKVRVVIRFRGREITYQQLGMEILQRVTNDVAEYGAVEQMPKMEGRQMVMTISPKK